MNPRSLSSRGPTRKFHKDVCVEFDLQFWYFLTSRRYLVYFWRAVSWTSVSWAVSETRECILTSLASSGLAMQHLCRGIIDISLKKLSWNFKFLYGSSKKGASLTLTVGRNSVPKQTPVGYFKTRWCFFSDVGMLFCSPWGTPSPIPRFASGGQCSRRFLDSIARFRSFLSVNY